MGAPQELREVRGRLCSMRASLLLRAHGLSQPSAVWIRESRPWAHRASPPGAQGGQRPGGRWGRGVKLRLIHTSSLEVCRRPPPTQCPQKVPAQNLLPGSEVGAPRAVPWWFIILCLAGDPSDNASSPPPQGPVSPTRAGSVFLGHRVPHGWKGAPARHTEERGAWFVQEPVSGAQAFPRAGAGTTLAWPLPHRPPQG